MNNRILILEDEPLFVSDLVEILESEGYSVRTASDSDSALKMLETFFPDIAICDINLGDGPSGIDFAEKAKQLQPKIKIIYVTAYSNQEIVNKAIDTNPVNYILKPWNIAQIKAALTIAFRSIQEEVEIEGKNTMLEKAFDELNVMNQELNDKFKSLELATEIALHDLRSPLKYMEKITRKGAELNDPDQMSENLQVIHEASTNILNFTNDTLNWMISNNKTIDIEKQSININSLLNRIINTYQPILEENGNKLILEIDEKIAIHTNEMLLNIILRNILDNANKYTLDGTITISVTDNKNSVVIAMIDTGSGFEITNNKQSGEIKKSTRLGLKIIEDLCNRLSFSYSIDSQIGQGTSVKISLQKN